MDKSNLLIANIYTNRVKARNEVKSLIFSTPIDESRFALQFFFRLRLPTPTTAPGHNQLQIRLQNLKKLCLIMFKIVSLLPMAQKPI